MAIALAPKHLKRYKDLAGLLVKHGGGELLESTDPELDALRAEGDVAGDPEELAADLEALGPTYVKLGQMLSTRPDLLPQAYLDALARLQDEVEPFSFEEVEEIVQRELGVRISKAFDSFDATPMAAASLGQTHRARMRDGREVVVKVQRPDIRETIVEDLESFDAIASLIDRHTEAGRRYAFSEMLGEFRRTLLRELDYREEARNLQTLGRNLRAYERIVVPQPVDDFTTSRVLTMDEVSGTKITDISPLTLIDLDGKSLAEDLCRAYLDQVLIDGFFHADPHPGNVFLTDARCIALLDLGLVAHLDEGLRDSVLRLILAVSEGQGREAAELLMRMGTQLDDFDPDRYRHALAEMVLRYQDRTLEEVSLGYLVMLLCRTSAENGVRPPSQLTMLGKTLLHVDEIGRVLAPDLDPNQVVREHASSLLQRHILRTLSPTKALGSMLEVNELVQRLPGQLNRALDVLADNRFALKVEAFDETRLMDNLQKIANRIALGLVLAALIVGAAMLMDIETRFTIFGYPGLAILLFLAASLCGFVLVATIIVRDDWKPRRGDKT